VADRNAGKRYGWEKRWRRDGGKQAFLLGKMSMSITERRERKVRGEEGIGSVLLPTHKENRITRVPGKGLSEAAVLGAQLAWKKRKGNRK